MVYRDGSCSGCPPCLWRKTIMTKFKIKWVETSGTSNTAKIEGKSAIVISENHHDVETLKESLLKAGFSYTEVIKVEDDE